jgi:flagellar assembly protein FliH
MASPARFLFDNDFASSEKAKSAVPPAELAAKLSEAERAGFARGMAAAKAEAEQQAAAALQRAMTAIEALNRTLPAIEAQLAAEAVAVAVAVAKKLAAELMAREPLAEISALAADCFRHLVAAPHVVVRVNDALHAPAREALEAIARGTDSRLVVLAEPDIEPGDCRIEWADGGIRRDSAAIIAVIDEAVERYIAARAGQSYLPSVSWKGQVEATSAPSVPSAAGATAAAARPEIEAGAPAPAAAEHQLNGVSSMPDVSWSRRQ